jgi:hypothetical protein
MKKSSGLHPRCFFFVLSLKEMLLNTPIDAIAWIIQSCSGDVRSPLAATLIAPQTSFCELEDHEKF